MKVMVMFVAALVASVAFGQQVVGRPGSTGSMRMLRSPEDVLAELRAERIAKEKAACAKRVAKKVAPEDADDGQLLAVGPASTTTAVRAGAAIRKADAVRGGDYGCGSDGKPFFRRAVVTHECGAGAPWFIHPRCPTCAPLPDRGWGKHAMTVEGDFLVADVVVEVGTKCNVWVEGGEYFPDHRHLDWSGVVQHRPMVNDTGAWLVLK